MKRIKLDLTEKEYVELIKNLDVARYVYSKLADFVDDKYKNNLKMLDNLVDKFLVFSDDELFKKFMKGDVNMDDENKYKDIFDKWEVLDDIDEYDKYTVWDETGVDLDEEDSEYDEEKEDIIKKLLNK